MDNVNFPVEVEAKVRADGYYEVHEDELARIGADMGMFSDPSDPVWPFFQSEVEVLS